MRPFHAPCQNNRRRISKCSRCEGSLFFKSHFNKLLLLLLLLQLLLLQLLMLMLLLLLRNPLN